MLFEESILKSTKRVKWIQHGAKRKPNDAQRERKGTQVDPKGLQKGAIWPQHGTKGCQKGAQWSPRSCVKTNEIEWNIVLNHKGGSFDPPFVL